MEDIYNKIVEIIREQMFVDSSEITGESRIMEDIGADSLDFVEIIMVIEDEFDIGLPDSATENIITINDLVKCVTEKLA